MVISDLSQRPLPARRTLAILAAAAAIGAGCVTVVPYQADEGTVDRLGLEDAKKKLAEVMNRAMDPRIATVEPRDDSVRYTWQITNPGAFYVPVTTTNFTEIFYRNIGRFELYENNNVFIWAPNDARVDKVMFGNQEDARAFVDLLMSMRARLLKRQ
jgi:hypothetical protein